MIAVKVSYTVKKSYVELNKEKISAFLKSFGDLDNSLFIYSVFQVKDTNTFVHISQYRNESIQHELLNIPSFLEFQKCRDENLETKPVIEILEYVGGSKD
ncbi:MAG TPA: hypothetical protein VGE44_03850 [Daejeonella sp.]|jgi:hypothetical protein|uniref:hypothetical protein n=1 Tax=Daejeonella sp. TaxID=2805397 RepID=UPI002EDADC2C